MDELKHALLVPYNGHLVRLSSLNGDKMAAAAVASSPFTSQEFALPLRSFNDHSNAFSSPLAPPSGQAENIPLANSGFANLSNLQTIEDFEKESLLPCDKLVPLQSKIVSSENRIKFQQLCDQLQFARQLNGIEVFPYNFKGKAIFGAETIETPEVFPSKTLAKEAVAKLAIERLQSLKQATGTGTKRKNDNRSPSPVDKTEDWITLLYHYSQRQKKAQPDFEFLQTPRPPFRYACKVKIDGGPLEPFGDETLFASKPDARFACAKQAVEWLRSNGLLDNTPVKRTDNSPTKRTKHETTQHTGVTQAMNDAGPDVDSPPPSPSTARQRVHELVAMLGFRTPKFQSLPSNMDDMPAGTTVGAFYDVAYVFDPHDVAKEPALAGTIGRVEKIFGENKAKNECCVQVLPILEGIRERRAMQKGVRETLGSSNEAQGMKVSPWRLGLTNFENET